MPEPDSALLLRLAAPDAATGDPPTAPPAPRRPRVNGLAYAGGSIRLGNYDAPVVVDLDGLSIPPTVPLLANHENRTAARVGVVKAWVKDGALYVAGEILSTSGTAAGIVEQGKAGADWQLSIGAEAREIIRVRAGRKVTANGREHVGPLVHVRKAVLREVSVIPVGADAATGLSIAAAISATWDLKGDGMGADADFTAQLNERDRLMAEAPERHRKEEERQAALKAAIAELSPEAAAGLSAAVMEERERVRRIYDICGPEDASLAAEAISDEWDLDKTQRMKLRLINARKPQGNILAGGYRRLPGDYEMGTESGLPMGGDLSRSAAGQRLLAAVCLKAGQESLAVEACGADMTEAVRRHGPDNAGEIVAAALRAEYADVPRGRDEMIRAGFSSRYLPGILETFGRRVLLNAYAEAPATWRTFARVQSVADFRAYDMVRLSALRPLERVAPGGELKHGELTEEPRIRFKADTFGEMLSIDRRDLTNDDLGAFASLAQALGIAAARTLNDCFWGVLLNDDTGHYSEDNRNLLKGPDTTLTVDSLGRAISLLHTRRDDKGNDLDLQPAVLVVPPELERTARALLESDQVIASPTKVMPAGNSLKNAVKLAVDARLSNTAKFTHAGPKRWLLATAPLHAPAVVAFIDGRERPTVEALGMQADVSRLAYVWRTYFDFGAALGDPKASVFSVGE